MIDCIKAAEDLKDKLKEAGYSEEIIKKAEELHAAIESETDNYDESTDKTENLEDYDEDSPEEMRNKMVKKGMIEK